MNRERRQRIKEVIQKLNNCSEELDSIKDKEDDARDSIPENLQDQDSYTHSEECSDVLEDAVSDINDVVASLDDII